MVVQSTAVKSIDQNRNDTTANNGLLLRKDQYEVILNFSQKLMRATLHTLIQSQNQGRMLRFPQRTQDKRFSEGERSDNLELSDPVAFQLDLLDVAEPQNAPDGGKRHKVDLTTHKTSHLNFFHVPV